MENNPLSPKPNFSTETLIPQLTEKQFQRIAAVFSSVIFVIVQRADGFIYFEYISDAAEIVHELSREQLLADINCMYDQMHPDDRSGYLQAVAVSREHLSLFNHEWRIITPSGKLKWIQAKAQAEQRENGDFAWYGMVEDISDRKRIEQRLQLSEKRFSSLSDSAPVGIFRTDAVGNCLYVNKRWSEIANLSLEEALGEGWSKGLHPEDQEAITTEWYQAVAESRLFRLEYRFLRPDGLVNWVYGEALAEKNEQDEIVGFIGTITDITDRKEIEQQLQQLNRYLEGQVEQGTAALQESEATKNRILAAIPDLLLRISRDGTCLNYIEPSLGKEKFLPIVNHLSEILPPDLLQNELQVIEQAIATKELQVREHQLLKRGRITYEEVRILAINDQEVLTIVRDITDRKQTENALQESQQFLQTVLDSLPLSVIWKNRESVLLGCNQFFAQLSGLASPQEVIGKNTFDFGYTEAEALKYMADDQAVMELGIAQIGIEETITLPSGEQRWIETNKVPLRNLEGNVVGILGTFQDISDRKLAENQLQKSEQRFRRMFESRAVGVIFANCLGEITAANDCFLEILGYTREDFETESINNWMAITPPEYLARDFEYMEQLIQHGEVSPWEKEYYRKDGSRITILIGAAFLTDTREETVCVIVNISDRKQAEDALQLSESRFRNAFDNTAVGMSLVSLEGRLLQVNDSLCTFWGYSEKELQQMTFQEITYPDDLALDWELFEQTIRGEIQNYTIEKRYFHQNGEIIWGLLSVSLVKNNQDQPLYFVAQIQDITDRKQSEKALKKSQQFIETIINTVPLPLFWKNRELVFLGCNQQLIQIIGLQSTQEIIGKTDFDLSLTEAQAIAYREKDQAVMESGKALLRVEETQILPNGEQMWIETHKAPLRDEENDIIGVVGMFLNITERKHYELELQQKNTELAELVKLREETLTFREDMANMIVHDLRNPLSTIILAAGIVQRYGDRPAQRALITKKINQILESGKQLQKMIDSLLFMAKLESGKILFNPVLTELHEFCAEIRADFELIANSRDIQLKSELPEERKSILIDETILRRIIDNLMSNALKFTPIGGQVTLSLEYLSENQFRIKVADTGNGIDETEKERIFQKFEVGTLKENMKNTSQTGLGLAFCKLAVEAQGGTLAIANNHPQGTIFMIEI